MKTVIHAGFVFLMFGLVSCDPKEYPPKALGHFTTISSNGLVTFTLVQGVENAVLSTSMMDSYYSVSGGQLSINGIGTMTIAVSSQKLLLSCQSCSVKGSGPLVVDTLAFYMHAGDLKLTDLQINSRMDINAINTGTYKVAGQAAFVNLSTINAVTYKGYDLITDSTYINTASIFDMEVNTTYVVNAFINSIGNVNYRGNPPIVRATITGSGKMVKK
jgi:hypothetical protein